jgi:hypothetical protein
VERGCIEGHGGYEANASAKERVEGSCGTLAAIIVAAAAPAVMSAVANGAMMFI